MCLSEYQFWEILIAVCGGLNCVSKKDMLKSLSLVPVNVTLFVNKVFEDVINLR